jgi:hypothetical protein
MIEDRPLLLALLFVRLRHLSLLGLGILGRTQRREIAATAEVELFAKSSRNRVILPGKIVTAPDRPHADFWVRQPSYATPR